MFPMPPIAEPRFDSASTRNVAEATTVSPSVRPRRISMRSSVAWPSSTERAVSVPSVPFTNTRVRSPVTSTADRGTCRTAARAVAAMRIVAYMPGLSARSEFWSATRIFTVRVSVDRIGATKTIRPWRGRPGMAAKSTATLRPMRTIGRSRSNTSPSTHTSRRSAT